MSLNPADYITRRVAGTRPTLSYVVMKENDPDLSVSEWQEIVRRNLRVALRPLNLASTEPLAPQITDTTKLDGYTRHAVTFTTRPGLTAFGYYLLPDHRPAKCPAFVCLPGHGRGVDSIVGIAENGEQRPLHACEEYQADFARQCVARGYIVLALEQISFGRRRGNTAGRNPGDSSCHADSTAALSLGESMVGWRTWDALRAVDFLQNCPEVDAQRIGMMGISGGGCTALFAAAVDTRIAACVVSGYLNTFADSILSVHHCVDNYFPGMRTVCEMPDVAALIAPRLLFAESGTRDTIFPLPGFEKAAAYVRRVYEAASVSDHFATEIFDGDHRFHGKGAFDFLRERLILHEVREKE